jgi:hypothetical protein
MYNTLPPEEDYTNAEGDVVEYTVAELDAGENMDVNWPEIPEEKVYHFIRTEEQLLSEVLDKNHKDYN